MKLLRSDKYIIPCDSKPVFCFPLLPVVRSKDVWRFVEHGVEYKIRLTSDSSTAGAKDLFADIKFRYWGVEDFARLVEQDDFIFSLDIKGFYNCLGAGPLMRKLQFFQDPHSRRKIL